MSLYYSPFSSANALRGGGDCLKGPGIQNKAAALLPILVLAFGLLLGGNHIATALESGSSSSDEALPINQLSDAQAANYIAAAQNARAEEENVRDLLIDLDGGSISNLSTQGWVQGTEFDTWTKQFNVDESVEVASPVRHGYAFLGWDTNGDGTADVNLGESYRVTEEETQKLTAVWEREDFTVSFVVDGETKLSVKVPYESTLWSDAGQVPWETANYPDGTATVGGITYEGEAYNDVVVTRGGSDGSYWYSFTLGERDDAKSFFACDSSLVESDANRPFSYWKMTQGGGGYQVLEEGTVFTAQFAQDPVYVINVHYRTSEGITVDTSQTVVKQMGGVDSSGTLAVEFSAPSVIEHYDLDEEAMAAYSVDGTKVDVGVDFEGPGSDGGTWTANLNVEQVFGESAGQTSYLSIVVTYRPQTVNYVVNYFQQNPDRTGYDMVKSGVSTQASYGDLVEIAGESYEGFKVSGRSRLALLNGVELVEPEEGSGGDITWDEGPDTFIIDIYYDRASYFIYPLWDSTESSVKAQRVTYGAAIGELEQPKRTGYEFDGWVWYRLDEGSGQLAEEQNYSDGSEVMPAYDLYAVAQWKPASVDFQVVLWLEDADSPSYSNVYQATVSEEITGFAAPVKTDDELTVSLDGDELVIENANSQELYRSSSLLKGYVNATYLGNTTFTSDEYAQFFSYNQQRTQQSPGNISLAEESGDSVSGGQLGEQFTVTVGADGTTSINVYYSRNLYSIDFVLGKYNGNTTEVSVNTKGSIGGSNWESLTGGIAGYAADGLETVEGISSVGWNENPTVFRSANAEDRSPIGRYGTKTIVENGVSYTCIVYQLTAKFEASVDAFWPTLDRVKMGDTSAWKRYVSDSPASGSYYRDVITAGSDQHNILNVYGIMDEKVLLTSDGSGGYRALEGDEQGSTVAHTMVAYWNNSEEHNDDMTAYQYYFLYEVLDTSVTPNSTGVVAFHAEAANDGAYEEGQLVSYGDKVYVFTQQSSTQLSTYGQSGQNQPSLKGFMSEGKQFEATSASDERPENNFEKNIYFFYSRDTYTLTLHNLSESYVLPESVWNYNYEGKTLVQLGWMRGQDGSVTVRYGASLAPLGDDEFMAGLTSAESGRLEYPIPETGENQRYFRGWALNQKLSIKADWSDGSSLLSVNGNIALYAEWSTPRHTVSYVLNGGTWRDEGDSKISYTLVTDAIPVSEGLEEKANVFLAYKHNAAQEEAAATTLSWYVQTQSTDRLYIDTLYETTLDEVMVWDESTDHWRVKDGLTLSDLQKVSKPSSETSFTGQYYCYMGDGGTDESNSHRRYVNVNKWLGDALDEPIDPVRNGYSFAGWYEFADGPFDDSNKVYLEDALAGGTVSIDAYREGYVYLDEVDDAHLLHAEGDGRLFYYADQIGYRLSFEYGASTVSATKIVYAAWVPQGDVDLTTMHLVSVSDATDISRLDNLELEGREKITFSVGDTETEYYVLESASETVSNGAVKTVSAQESYIDDKSKVWLPDAAVRRVSVTDATQTATVTESDGSKTVTLDDLSGSHRVDSGDETYSYYAHFIYERTDQVQYHVYAINLSLAVANGSLESFEDTYDRANPPATDESFVLSKEDRTYTLSGSDDVTVSVTAPELSGYTVYRDTEQDLALATDEGSNNVYFYYVPSDGSQRYTITYHLMHEGSYETGRTVTFAEIPAATGEFIRKEQLVGLYDSLVNTAYLVDDYSGADASTNEGKLFERYKGMTITLKSDAGDGGKTFTVDSASSANANELDREEALAFNDGAVYDGHNPTNDVQVVQDGSTIDVYLRYAQLTVQKVDWQDSPVQDCSFTLTRLVSKNDSTSDDADVVLYDLDGDGTPEQYVVDASAGTPPAATSDAEGKAVFYDLYASDRYVYLLQETAWPTGYAPLKEPVAVAVPQQDASGATVYEVTYTIKNNGVVKLPYTGFFGGVYTPLIVGGACVAAAVVAIVLRSRKGGGVSRGRHAR